MGIQLHLDIPRLIYILKVYFMLLTKNHLILETGSF